MNGLGNLALLASAEVLGKNHRCAGGHADKKANHQVDQGSRGAANRGKRFLADKFAHNDGVCSVVQLLKKGSQQNGKEENQKLPPDNALGNSTFIRGASPAIPCHDLCSFEFVALGCKAILYYRFRRLSSKNGR